MSNTPKIDYFFKLVFPLEKKFFSVKVQEITYILLQFLLSGTLTKKEGGGTITLTFVHIFYYSVPTNSISFFPTTPQPSNPPANFRRAAKDVSPNADPTPENPRAPEPTSCISARARASPPPARNPLARDRAVSFRPCPHKHNLRNSRDPNIAPTCPPRPQKHPPPPSWKKPTPAKFPGKWPPTVSPSAKQVERWSTPERHCRARIAYRDARNRPLFFSARKKCERERALFFPLSLGRAARPRSIFLAPAEKLRSGPKSARVRHFDCFAGGRSRTPARGPF